ncbi:MAG: RHS repeat-associated core domain-containing protein [Rhizomicrobium sp.]|nr:RHS repeat-associated core domain-containing protein [Rhizomicrobium sp.]
MSNGFSSGRWITRAWRFCSDSAGLKHVAESIVRSRLLAQAFQFARIIFGSRGRAHYKPSKSLKRPTAELSAKWACTVFVALLLVEPATAFVNAAPSTVGQFAVSAMGTSTYSIPISVAPSTGGFAPAMAITYSSEGGDSYLGYGWTFSGLSMITYDGAGVLKLDGQRLVAVSGQYGGDGTVYHTEIESYSKIVSYGQTAGMPNYFKVWTKSGLVLEIGNTSDSRIQGSNGYYTAWGVDKTSDAKSNYYTITYTPTTLRPSTINYAGNANKNLAPSRTVQITFAGNTTYISSGPHLYTLTCSGGTQVASCDGTPASNGQSSYVFKCGDLTAQNQFASMAACWGTPLIPNKIRTRLLTVAYVDNMYNSFGAVNFDYQGGAVSTNYAYEVLTGITQMAGATTSISYNLVTADTSTTRYAVNQVSNSNGIVGDALTTTYAYSGFFNNNPSHDSYGFAQRIVTDSHLKVSTINYYTDFPRAGFVSSQTDVLPSGMVLNSNRSDLAMSPAGSVTYSLVSTTQTPLVRVDLNGAALPMQTITVTYDSFGNAVQTNTSVSDGSSQVVTDTFTNDVLNWRLGQLTDEKTQTTVGSSTIIRHTSYVHDPATAFVTQKIVEPSDSAHQVTTSYSYDDYGHVTSTSASAAGVPTRTATATYDSNGIYKTQACNAAGQCHNYVTTEGSDYNFFSTYSVADKDPNGLTTTTRYDLLGRAIVIVGPDGNQLLNDLGHYFTIPGGGASGLCDNTNNYFGPSCPTGTVFASLASPRNANGGGVFPIPGQSSLTNLNGAQQVTYYDSLGRVIATDKQGFGGAWIRQSQTYDHYGRVVTVSRPYFVNGTPVWTTYSYDDLDRVNTVTAPDGGVTRYGYNGTTTSVTNAKGQTTTALHNAQGRVESITDALGNKTAYAYDAAGSPTTITDAAKNVITNTFDVVGNKLTSSDPDRGSWSYTYDPFGELTQQKDAKGQVTQFIDEATNYPAYDLLGRVTQRREEAGGGYLYSNWKYDQGSMGIGKPSKTCTSSASNLDCTSATSTLRNVTYDVYGRPTASNLSSGGGSYAYATTYNSNGQIATVTYPSGLKLAYVYDAYGYLTSINDTSGNPYWSATSANADLMLTGQTYGNGVVQSNGFDPLTGVLETVWATKNANGDIAQLNYLLDGKPAYDKLGNLLYKSDSLHGTFENFCYDDLNRLTKSSMSYGAGGIPCGGTGSKSTSYDATGNIVSKSDVGSYSYPAPGAAQPHGLTGVNGTVNGVVNPTYSYDPNGNMTAGGGRSITYTSFNMVSTIATGTTSVSLGYDSDHSRVSQTLTINGGAATTTYVNDPITGAMSERAASSGTVVWRDYIQVGGRIVAEISSGGIPAKRYFVADHLGSTAVLTDENGLAVEPSPNNFYGYNAYDAWGKRRKVDGSDDTACALTPDTSRGYTGHEHIDALCLINMNARLYDPALGRFLGTDPLLSSGDNGQGLNPYSYVTNRPLYATDPTGMDPNDPGTTNKGAPSGGTPPIVLPPPIDAPPQHNFSFGVGNVIFYGSTTYSLSTTTTYSGNGDDFTITGTRTFTPSTSYTFSSIPNSDQIWGNVGLNLPDVQGGGPGVPTQRQATKGADPNNANTDWDKVGQCLLNSGKKNGASLAFDAAGVGLLVFTPEGEISAAYTVSSLAVAGGATLNAAAHGDFPGVGIGVAGYHVAAFDPTLRTSGLGAVAGRLGWGAVAISSAYDLKAAISDYNSCMSH